MEIPDSITHTLIIWVLRQQTVSLNTIGFRRGYTGHEHLPEFGLINMNGRMYDPVIARFLSPDPFVQDPDFSQSFNRYSYCWNNPLVYTDPSGEFFWMPIIIGAVMGGITGAIQADMNGKPWHQGAIWGSLIGGATGFLSGFSPTNWVGSTLYGTGLGTASAGGMAQATGGDVKEAMITGAIAGGISGFISSEQFGNMRNGEGFRSNNKVLNNFVSQGKHQEALDYFGFEGKYDPNKTSRNFQASKGSYWGATNSSGDISYGNLAFTDHKTLKATFYKEKYTMGKILSGKGISKLPADLQGLGADTFLEEIEGYMYTYKNQALYLNSNFPYQGVNFYQSRLRSIDFYDFPTYPKLNFLHKIPRRW